tara:strand:- start:5113 stop:6546 length:1434 start_codon:yes stop_codon:yes gene_type:complete
MSSNISLPPALLTAPMATVSTMNVETNVLDPIIINQGFARFVLERKGILDTGSAFTFSVHTVAAGDQKGFLPLKTGIHSLIKRAVLRIGSKIVAITDDYAHYMTIRRQFKTCEEKSQKDMVKTGCVDVVCPQNEQEGQLQVRDVTYSDDTTSNIINQYVLTSDETHTPIYSIRISELFPMMRNVQLPLYLINEPCSIELTFNTQSTGAGDLGKVACFEQAYVGGGGDTSITLATRNVKFLADYLTYDDDRMNQTAKIVMSENGMSIPYEDVVLTSTQYPAANPAPTGAVVQQQNIVRDLGLSGMMVRSILCSQGIQTNNALLGRYNSPAYNVPDSYNVRVNDRQRYPRHVESESQKAYQLSQVFSTDIAVANSEYSNDQSTNKQVANNAQNNLMFCDSTLEGHSMALLEGKQHYIGIDFSVSPLNQANNGVLVGQKPIQILHTINRTAQNNADRDVRFFSLVERTMTLRGGMVQVSA